MNEIDYTIPGMSCGHCERVLKSELATVPGVSDVAVDLQSKRVSVRGDQLDADALRAAIDAAGYEVA